MRIDTFRFCGPLLLVLVAGNSQAAVEDNPLLLMGKLDKLEVRDADEGTAKAWEGHFWAGKDLDKLWIKFEGESSDEGTESSEFQLLYSRAVDANWDLQAGFRHDADPEPTRDWLALGFLGVAPYFIEMDGALFFGDDEQINLRLEAEYEIMLTQKWVVAPEIEINWFAQDDDELGIGSGLSEIEAGIRLRYEINRHIAPYIGIDYERLYGDTRDLARASDEDASETRAVAGLRLWF